MKSRRIMGIVTAAPAIVMAHLVGVHHNNIWDNYFYDAIGLHFWPRSFGDCYLFGLSFMNTIHLELIESQYVDSKMLSNKFAYLIYLGIM